MPKLFVVGAEKTLAELAPTLLRSRTSAAARKGAVEAIRRANPGLDLDRIAPGTVVLVPEVEGLRSSVRAADPVEQAADDLLSRVRDGVKSMVAAAQTAEEAQQREREAARELVGSPMVERLSAQSPELSRNVESLRATLEADDDDAIRRLEEVRGAAEEWAAGLDELRALLP